MLRCSQGAGGVYTSSAGKSSDRHAADAGSIPRCHKGFLFFFSQKLSVQTILRCAFTPLCAIGYISVCAHVEDHVIHTRVRWIMQTLRHPVCIEGWVARLCCGWLSPGKATRICHGRNPNGTIQLSIFLDFFKVLQQCSVNYICAGMARFVMVVDGGQQSLQSRE